MKYLVLAMVSVALVFNTAADEKAIENLVKESVSVKSTLAAPDVTGKVFKGKFYSSETKIDSGDYNVFRSTSVVIGGKAKFLWQTSTDRDMKVLLSCVKDDFKLKSEQSIKDFENALDKIYPTSKFAKEKQVIKAKDKIIFVRGKFFKKFKGFVVDIDSKGKIKSINYKLKIEN